MDNNTLKSCFDGTHRQRCLLTSYVCFRETFLLLLQSTLPHSLPGSEITERSYIGEVGVNTSYCSFVQALHATELKEVRVRPTPRK